MSTLKRIGNWLRQNVGTTTNKVVGVYLVGVLALAAAAANGLLGPVLVAAGWVAWGVAVLALGHAVLAVRLARRVTRNHPIVDSEAQIGWLEKLDTSILGFGFLGKLYGIAMVLAAISGADAQAGVAKIAAAVGTALFATMLGLGTSLWTHNVTLVLTNAVASEKDRLFYRAGSR